MDGALAVNTECRQFGTVPIGVVLGDGLGFVDVVARKVVLGGVGGRVVGLSVEDGHAYEWRPPLEQDEAGDGNPDHQLYEPAADHPDLLSSCRVKTVSSSTPSARAAPANVITPTATEASTRAASARPRSSLMPMETRMTAAAITTVATAIRATVDVVPASAMPPVRRRRSHPATAAATT